MALEFICSNEIICRKKIVIPVNMGANFYKLKSGKIKFFYTDSLPMQKMKEIPVRSIEVSFQDYRKGMYSITYGEPTFYNAEGNILKDCNGIKLWANQ